MTVLATPTLTMILAAGVISASGRVIEMETPSAASIHGPNYAIVSNEEERINRSITSTRRTYSLASFINTFKMPVRYDREHARRRYDRRIFPQ